MSRPESRQRRASARCRVVWVACIAAALVAGCAERKIDRAPEPETRSEAIMLSEDEQRVAAQFEAQSKEYVAMQHKLRATLPRLPEEATPQQVDMDQRLLGALIRDARVVAEPGEFFSPGMHALVQRVMSVIVSGPDRANLRGSILDENPGVPELAINSRYPDTVPLSTMPPQVLEALPKLPEELEYRFIGERLVLMDSDAHVILDYTGDVLP